MERQKIDGKPRAYTDRERAAFKDAYAKRWRKKLMMIALLFAVMTALAVTEDDDTIVGIPAPVSGPIALVVIFAGWVVVENGNWRCPACNEYLGRAFNPKRCRGCGIELRG